MSGRGEQGSATAFVSVGVAVVLLVTGMFVAVITAHLASNQARAAADLAAVAAAGRVAPGVTGRPCEVARRVAERNGGRLVSCQPGEREVTVRVEVDVALPGAGAAGATARAGLVPAVGSAETERGP